LLHKPAGTNTPVTDHLPTPLLLLLQGATSAATAAATIAAAAGKGVLPLCPTWLEGLLLLMLPEAAGQLVRVKVTHMPQLLLLLLCRRPFLHPVGNSCNTYPADAPAAAVLMHQSPTAML
jgi:hypothetical protein